MPREVGLTMLLAGAIGLALLALGVVYLAVECQSLPGFLGPVHGDAGYRTGRGIAGIVLGAAALVAIGVAARRRR